MPNLDFDVSGHLYATHRLHAYAARFPPPLARWAIESYTSEGDIVLDPMVGSGTTMVEAALTGRTGWGADIDPLARLIAMAKSTPIKPERIVRAADRIEQLFRDDEAGNPWRPDLPNFDKWFREDVARDLAKLKTAIPRAARRHDLRNLLWVMFSSLIVARTSVANARDLVHSRHHYREWERDPGVMDRFLTNTRRAARLMQKYIDALSHADQSTPPPRIVGNDARDLPVPNGSVNAVVTSPPYCSALDYTRAHMFAVAWLGDALKTTPHDYRILGREYVGSEKAPLAESTDEQSLPPPLHPQVDSIVDALQDDRKRAWIVHKYFREMFRVLVETARVVRPGGHAVFVVCPSNIRKVAVPTHSILNQIAPDVTDEALRSEALYERTIPDRRRVMPYIEKAFGPRMRTEYVLVLRRG